MKGWRGQKKVRGGKDMRAGGGDKSRRVDMKGWQGQASLGA